MHTETLKSQKRKSKGDHVANNTGGFIWFLGFIGAFVHYIQEASGFGEGVVGFFKALVWPAILVYRFLASG